MTNDEAGTVFVLNADTMGRGDDVLGAKLVGSFLRTLAVTDPKPDAIVFYNAAVGLLARIAPPRAAPCAGRRRSGSARLRDLPRVLRAHREDLGRACQQHARDRAADCAGGEGGDGVGRLRGRCRGAGRIEAWGRGQGGAGSRSGWGRGRGLAVHHVFGDETGRSVRFASVSGAHRGSRASAHGDLAAVLHEAIRA